MKTGRNDPCPCGSGKKYKKCCLNKSVAPPEALHYRRLSQVYDKMGPKLLAYGEAVFGEMAPQAAFAEFLAWPDPEDFPDEAAMERAEHLFWPWYIFNWEYSEMEDEEGDLGGPEDTTITELFLQEKKVEPGSLEGRFLAAANRTPYSFHEIVATDTGHTVSIRDVLTGREVLVQERIGSEYMQKGDLIFGRAVQVGDVHMFLGLSPFRIPPRMKPEVIHLRRRISRYGAMLSTEDLYEWDLDIRELYWDMDRRLHTMPQMVNTDGDPMEVHRVIYDIDSAELAVEKLADLSAVESLAQILDDAEKDRHGRIRKATLSWSRKGKRANQGMDNTILGMIDISAERLIASVNSAERARAIRGKIERRMADKARFRLDEISDLSALMARQNQKGVSPQEASERLSHPEVQQHIEQMLRQHWERWPRQKIPLLGNKTPRQAVKTRDGRESVEALLLDAENLSAGDPVRYAAEKQLIDDVRRQLKLDEPFVEKAKTVDAQQTAARVKETKRLLSEFGEERLPDFYTDCCRRLCDAIAAARGLNVHLGRVEIWAAAIVYAIARLNFLFSSETPNALTADEVCDWFGVKKTTVSNKASTILGILNIFHDDRRFCAPHVTRMFEFVEDEHGFIHPVGALSSGENSRLAPIALKPGNGQKRAPEKVQEKTVKPSVEKDDKQLKLFPD